MKPIWFPMFVLGILSVAIYITHRNWGFWRTGYNDASDKWLAWVATMVVSTVVSLLAFALSDFISCVIADHSDQEWKECWRAKMVSLRTADGVNGSVVGGMFLLSGHVGSEQFYYYYSLNRDGTFVPHKWKADTLVRILEEDRKDGEVIQSSRHFKHTWVLWFAEPSDDLAMDFHIPKGSLQQTFSIQ